MSKHEFHSAEELLKIAKENNLSVSEVVIRFSMESEELPREHFWTGMKKRYDVMKQAIKDGLKINTRSRSGLSGGDALKLDNADINKSLLGKTLFTAVKYAYAIQEHNARFGIIVAFPTAGSSGTVPATLVSAQENCGYSEEQVISALFTAAGIGMITGENACLAGASGGCQAEVGTASAMAAAALTELRGGTPEQALDAASIALKSVLGLVCDPIGGLVEAPCVKRNAMAVANAYTASDVVIFGVKSNVSYDEVVFAMKDVGDKMSADLKETSRGGLAITPTGCHVCKKLGLTFAGKPCGGNCAKCFEKSKQD